MATYAKFENSIAGWTDLIAERPELSGLTLTLQNGNSSLLRVFEGGASAPAANDDGIVLQEFERLNVHSTNLWVLGYPGVEVLITDSVVPVSDVTQTGSKDLANSSKALLGAGETFTGDIVFNDRSDIGWSMYSDQDGELYIDIYVDEGVVLAFSKRYDIVGGERGRFDAFKKGSRAHRARFVNGAGAQTEFALSTFTGANLFPYSRSERDDPVGVAIGVSGLTSTAWRCYVDLDNRAQWPHRDVGRIDIHSANFFYDKTSNCRGAIRLGVITRVDATNADVAIVLGDSFDNSDLTKDSRDREFRNPIKLGQSGGELTKYFTNSKLLNVAAINTATPLASGKTGVDVTPAVGDVVVQFEVTGGTLTSGFVSGTYAGNASST